ncbi:hypothetical protein RclHR1_00030049 [Rhizophagus clarus]|uniref:Uncharacterized protein n=1 Tax=Rhizophagus clarus TaxID=94130 RepID=A0A2Z6R941_9GLOM|nr:hypothetical protein RclHR1_00030049 [Rhizophagus clarus]GES95557.1 hypothetical protein GLOIN_2v925111 [Rhizophagus clarus]
MIPTVKISVTASFLLSECLEKIFSNLLDENPSRNIYTFISMKDLHSCTLVSRHWCRISSPFLYAYPFHYFHHLADSISHSSDHLQYFKLIRTLLSCIPKSEFGQIKSSNSFNTSTFNYITFIRGLILDKITILYNPYTLFTYRNLWLPSYNTYNDLTEDQFSKILIPIINHFIKFLCKHCNNLTTLQFKLNMQNNRTFNNIIEFLSFKDFNERNKLKNLKELYFINDISKNDELPSNLYLALSNKVCNLNLLYNENISTIEEASSLSKFISLQEKLQHIILSEDKLDIFLGDNIGDNYYVVLSSLSSQSESLKVLEFKYIPFNRIDGNALTALCSLKNIRELKFYMCRAISDKLNSWAKNLTRLEVIEFMAYYFPAISEEFLIQLIRSSSNTLTKLTLLYKREQNQSTRLFQQISHLNSLVHLELPKIYSYELILIFKSCTRLDYLSTILPDDELWENFRDLGKFIPNTLRTIQFKEMHNLVFSSIELKYFLEECINNDSNLTCLEIVGSQHIGKDYFDVAVECGIILYYANC